MATPLSRDATVAVVGAGTMGAGIAQVAAVAGHRVLLFDARPGAAQTACRSLASTLDTLVAKGKLDADAARAAAQRVTPVETIGDCASAALVIEAIVEDLDVKRALFAELETVVGVEAILASNTSSLSLTSLAAGLRHPRRVVGMHFFNPAPVLPLVEVVRGLATHVEIAETVHATAAAWGKTPVHATSTPGFIVNRCARPFYGEAWRLLNERAASPATIDAVMREAGGFRMGPFELMDLIGQDVNLAVTTSVWKAYHHDSRYTPSVAQRELVDAGFHGRKTQRGIYDYAEGRARPEVATEASQPAPARVVVHGDTGPAQALIERVAKAGLTIERAPAHPAFGAGAFGVDGAMMALTDGRTATARANAAGLHDLVVFDLAGDYASCTRLAIACADACADAARDRATGMLQAAGIAVSRFDDVAGLAVMRTVAMLANEAADAVAQGVASARDVDIAMRKGVNYPRGPLAWADAIGVARVREVLVNLRDHYGEERYRVAPLIER
ncbi:MAG: 3-hydroxyacyl-CoA dehydrogenase PaaH, partial [Betaproteobacteria bacterium]